MLWKNPEDSPEQIIGDKDQVIWKNPDDNHNKVISQSEIMVLYESLNTSTDILEETDSTNVEPQAHTPRIDSHLKNTHGEGGVEDELGEMAVNKDMGEVGPDRLAVDGVNVCVHDPVEGHNASDLGNNLEVLNVLTDLDDLVEHVDMGEVGSDKLAEDGVHVRVHDPVEGHNGYKIPEDVLKLMEYVLVDEKRDTMEDLRDHMEVLQTEGDTTKQVDTLEDLVKSDDEGQEAETITVKLTLKQ